MHDALHLLLYRRLKTYEKRNKSFSTFISTPFFCSISTVSRIVESNSRKRTQITNNRDITVNAKVFRVISENPATLELNYAKTHTQKMEDHDDEMDVLTAEPVTETHKHVNKKMAKNAKTVTQQVPEIIRAGGRRAAKQAALISKNARSTTVAPQGKRGGKNSLAVAAVEVKATRKGRPATISERRVYFAQRGTEKLLRKAPFVRLVREIAQDLSSPLMYKEEIVDPNFSKNALELLHIAAEDFIIHRHAQANKIANNSGRCTMYARDMKTVEAVDSMKAGGVLERTIYFQPSADGKRRKLVQIGTGGKIEEHPPMKKKIM